MTKLNLKPGMIVIDEVLALPLFTEKTRYYGVVLGKGSHGYDIYWFYNDCDDYNDIDQESYTEIINYCDIYENGELIHERIKDDSEA